MKVMTLNKFQMILIFLLVFMQPHGGFVFSAGSAQNQVINIFEAPAAYEYYPYTQKKDLENARNCELNYQKYLKTYDRKTTKFFPEFLSKFSFVNKNTQPDSLRNCENLGCFNELTPSPEAKQLGDMAYYCHDTRMAVIEVGGGNGIFFMNGKNCQIIESSYKTPFATSQRGCAILQSAKIVFAGGWNEGKIYALNFNFNIINETRVGLAISGLATDNYTNILYIATQEKKDKIYEAIINPDFSVALTGRSWIIPWQSSAGGFCAASLDFNEYDGVFGLINLKSNNVEFFQFKNNELLPLEYCKIQGVENAWGFDMGMNYEEFHVAGSTESYSPPFPVYKIYHVLATKCEMYQPDFEVVYIGSFSTSRGTPLSMLFNSTTNVAQPACPSPLTVFVTVPGSKARFNAGTYEKLEKRKYLPLMCSLPVPTNVRPGQYHLEATLEDSKGNVLTKQDIWVNIL